MRERRRPARARSLGHDAQCWASSASIYSEKPIRSRIIARLPIAASNGVMKYNQADQGADAEHPAIEREANGDCSH
jgi:hypothetical protein